MADRGRVLQLSTMVPPARFGGAESVVQAFAEQLCNAGFSVHNAGLTARGAAEPGTPIPNLYWPFDGHRRGAAARVGWHAIDALTLRGRSAVERVVDDFDPQVLVTHNLRGWGLAPWVVAQQRGIPLVHVVHDYGLLCNNSTLWHNGTECGPRQTACRLRASRAVSRWPGGLLVGVSEAVLAEHRRRRFGTADPCAVVHPVAAATAVGPRLPRSTAGVPTTFGYLGRLTAEKGVGELVEAISSIDATLIVAGEGDRSEVRALRARVSDQVQWWGWTEPAKLFAAIDVLVVPSLWREPFGLVVVEAARAGVPVLVADQPGLLEAVRSSGALYRSYPANDAVALRNSMSESLQSYRQEPAQKSDVDIVDLVAGRIVGAGS